jgi:hypothetical protein
MSKRPADNDFKRLQEQFSAHLRDPDNNPRPAAIEDRRMAIYRELIFSNIHGFLSNGFPVLKSIYAEDDWLAMMRDFLQKHRSQSPLFQDIAREFLSYLEHERNDPADPPFLQPLAHYECVELALSVLDSPFEFRTISQSTDVMQLQLQTSPLAWPLAYDYPVHQISPQYQPTEPLPVPIFLLVYRDEDDNVKFIELNPVSARLIDLLNEGHTGEQAASMIAEEIQHPDPAVVHDGARQEITNWLQQGIVI